MNALPRGWTRPIRRLGTLWGVDPDSLLVESVESFRPGSVLDLGAGDGRNALFLARRGFAVTAVDAAPLALETLDAAAASEGLIVETELADLASYEVTRSYDNVVSTLTLHFLPQQAAVSLMRRLRVATVAGGINLISLLTRDGPVFERANGRGFWLAPGELAHGYRDWQVVAGRRRVITTRLTDDAGTPYRQPVDELLARKPTGGAAAK